MTVDCSWKEAMEHRRICVVMDWHRTNELDMLLSVARANFKKESIKGKYLVSDGRPSLMVYGFSDFDTTGLKKLKEDSEKNGGYLEILPTEQLREILKGVKNDYKALADFINEKNYKFSFFYPAIVFYSDRTKDGHLPLDKKKLYIDSALVKNAVALMKHSKDMKKSKPILFFVVYDVSEMILNKDRRSHLIEANDLIRAFLK